MDALNLSTVSPDGRRDGVQWCRAAAVALRRVPWYERTGHALYLACSVAPVLVAVVLPLPAGQPDLLRARIAAGALLTTHLLLEHRAAQRLSVLSRVNFHNTSVAAFAGIVTLSVLAGPLLVGSWTEVAPWLQGVVGAVVLATVASLGRAVRSARTRPPPVRRPLVDSVTQSIRMALPLSAVRRSNGLSVFLVVVTGFLVPQVGLLTAAVGLLVVETVESFREVRSRDGRRLRGREAGRLAFAEERERARHVGAWAYHDVCRRPGRAGFGTVRMLAEEAAETLDRANFFKDRAIRLGRSMPTDWEAWHYLDAAALALDVVEVHSLLDDPAGIRAYHLARADLLVAGSVSYYRDGRFGHAAADRLEAATFFRSIGDHGWDTALRSQVAWVLCRRLDLPAAARRVLDPTRPDVPTPWPLLTLYATLTLARVAGHAGDTTTAEYATRRLSRSTITRHDVLASTRTVRSPRPLLNRRLELTTFLPLAMASSEQLRRCDDETWDTIMEYAFTGPGPMILLQRDWSDVGRHRWSDRRAALVGRRAQLQWDVARMRDDPVATQARERLLRSDPVRPGDLRMLDAAGPAGLHDKEAR